MKVFGITGWKNGGKTGLVERLVAEFSARGLDVATIKHAHHVADVDHEGTDTYRHRQAGAGQVILSATSRWAHMVEHGGDEPSLADSLKRLNPCDLVLVEGFKRSDIPKIEAYRAETGKHPLALENSTIRAVACKGDAAVDRPTLDLDDTSAIADAILQFLEPNPAQPKPLRNDCFALPPGVNWVPVDQALARLKDALAPVCEVETIATRDALHRITAAPVTARRSNPPAPNSAVDGYGFAHATLPEGLGKIPLVQGRAAAGDPFTGLVPAGHAIRILTGAILPEGVDTVVLEEDCTIADSHIQITGKLKAGSNTRKAGEDVKAGDIALPAGHKIRPPDIALLSALGVAQIQVHKSLRVGVLSTGDELIDDPSAASARHHIPDANRPMLLSLAQGWGYEPVDLGCAPDDPDAIRGVLNNAVGKVDVILTSGGASAGDEDHVSRILRDEGHLYSWRIAVKPGRPLALANWQGVPVIGLPGNPVAAMVCSLIFARPALSLLAGGGWLQTQGMMVPAGFTKSKKHGRREYLRARLTPDGHAEVFKSEGSGRISGLTWADGLVELPDEGMEIIQGTPVRFIPYATLGL